MAGEEIEESSSLQQGECALSRGGSQTSSWCPALLWWDGDSWGTDIRVQKHPAPEIPSLSCCASPGSWYFPGLSWEVGEQNQQISLVCLPSISPCCKLYAGRAVHATGCLLAWLRGGDGCVHHCGPGETMAAVLGMQDVLHVFGMGLWGSVSIQRA